MGCGFGASVVNRSQLNRAQVLILDSLRHKPEARFSELMQPTGLTSDTFKFHIRALTKSGYTAKTDKGLYALTAGGKEFANRLDLEQLTVQRQPKLSVLIIAEQKRSDGQTEYLFHHRQRNPFYGYWSFVGGPVLWGEDTEQVAKRELLKQADLQAATRIAAFCRKIDFSQEDSTILEDKLFAIVWAKQITGTLKPQWRGGDNAWLTIEDLRSKEKYFEDSIQLIQDLYQGHSYRTLKKYYSIDDY